jgi:UDP-GlcNAc:undecaprenyl-phosphate GlcNAc-1-phosphate transferase
LILCSFILAFLISYVAIPTIVRVSTRKKLFDHPNERTSHKESIPTLGGMAIFAGFLISVIVFSSPGDSLELRYLFGACIILFFAGLKDDILIIDPKKKLISQLLAALFIVVLGDIRITDFHSVLGIDSVPYSISILFTVFMIVGLINGFNLIDGVDGLSSGIGIINSIVFGILFLIDNQTTYSVIAFSVSGALAAYFIFNVFGKTNKIFMGDTGSMLTGLVISILAIKFLETKNGIAPFNTFYSSPSLAFGLLILPIFDTFRVSIFRLANGGSPFKADKNHIHHNLLRLGLSHLQVSLILITATILFSTAACLLKSANAFWLMIIFFIISTGLSGILDFIIKRKTNLHLNGVN